MTTTTAETIPAPLSLDIDWKQYFKEFCQTHGDPVNYKPKNGPPVLLFADGWSYHGLDYAGPEWPPPADVRAMRRHQIRYWRLYLEMVSGETAILAGLTSEVAALQATKSLPLPMTSFDRQAVAERLAWLAEAAAHARQQLANLKKEDQA